MANVYETTLFGGKPQPSWQEGDFSLPGYQNAKITFKDINDPIRSYQWGFLVSPSSVNVQYGNDIQANKTMAGWFISKNGPSVGTLTISGYLLDTLQTPERLRFLDLYKNYIADKQNNYMEFYNNYTQSITIEGITYSGLIQSVQQSKSGNQHFLYQYNITMVFYDWTRIYAINDSVSMSEDKMASQMGISPLPVTNLTSVTSTSSIKVSKGVMSILTGK